jgi:hypothetical protein
MPDAGLKDRLLDPVRPSCSRNRSSSDVRLSTVTEYRSPLTDNETRLVGDVSAATGTEPSPPTVTAPPTTAVAAMNVRRDGPVGGSSTGVTVGSGSSVDMPTLSFRRQIQCATAISTGRHTSRTASLTARLVMCQAALYRGLTFGGNDTAPHVPGTQVAALAD